MRDRCRKKCYERSSLCVCVTRDNIMIFHRFGIGAAVCADCQMITKAHRNVGGQMWHCHSTQVAGKDAHTHLFLTLFMGQAKAPAGETHSTLYSLGTCDCGGKKRRKGGGRRNRGRSEKKAQVEALGFRDVQLSLKYKVITELIETFWALQTLLIHSCYFEHLRGGFCLLQTS